MKKIKDTFLLSIAFYSILCLFNSCATIFTGTSQNIHFNSEPKGARIIINGLEMGRTPASIKLSKPGFSNTTVTLRLESYEDRTFILDKSFNVISVINFLGIFPWVIDLATGAFMNYSPDGYDVTLGKAKAELKEKLEVDEIILTRELKKEGNKFTVEDDKLSHKKTALLDEKSNTVLIFE